MITDRVMKQTFQYIIDKVQSKLAGWKSKMLIWLVAALSSISFASVSNYTMQTAWLPLSTFNSLNKWNRNFLWGRSENGNKLHLMSWITVTKKIK